MSRSPGKINSVPALYHGTSSAHHQKIITKGLTRPCLTMDEDLAWYYAECSVEGTNYEPIIFKVQNLSVPELRVNITAIEEPVFNGNEGFEEEVWAAADAWCEKAGIGSWMELTWQASLEITACVSYRKKILPENLELIR